MAWFSRITARPPAAALRPLSPLAPSTAAVGTSVKAPISNRAVAAISHDDRAGDVGREIAGKEDRRPDDVLWLPGAAERRVVQEDAHELGVVGARFLVQRRLDQAGADGVDPHPVLAEDRKSTRLNS